MFNVISFRVVHIWKIRLYIKPVKISLDILKITYANMKQVTNFKLIQTHLFRGFLQSRKLNMVTLFLGILPR